ncbi:NmrA/HSCARG family protein [Hymenobacter terrigena]
MQKKLITVFGATGAQGGGLVRAILNDPSDEFTVRAVTRDVHSPKAQQLVRHGAQVVAGDLDDPASIRRAMAGAYGAYCVTFFWEHFSPEKEDTHARNMAQAAKDAGLKHVIWSTLEDSRKWIPLSDNRMPTLMGKYKVPHLDAKGGANHYFSDLKVPTTFLLTSFYWENFIYFGMGPKPGPDGKLAISFPLGNSKLSGIAAEDIGKCALGIFKKGKALIGKTVGIAGEQLTGQQMADTMTKVFGLPIAYNELTPEQYRNLGFPGADDLGNMFQFQRDFAEDSLKARDLAFSRELNPELQTFSEWLIKNGQRIPVEQLVS